MEIAKKKRETPTKRVKFFKWESRMGKRGGGAERGKLHIIGEIK
jgi:hypothetical protein